MIINNLIQSDYNTLIQSESKVISLWSVSKYDNVKYHFNDALMALVAANVNNISFHVILLIKNILKRAVVEIYDIAILKEQIIKK